MNSVTPEYAWRFGPCELIGLTFNSRAILLLESGAPKGIGVPIDATKQTVGSSCFTATRYHFAVLFAVEIHGRGTCQLFAYIAPFDRI